MFSVFTHPQLNEQVVCKATLEMPVHPSPEEDI